MFSSLGFVFYLFIYFCIFGKMGKKIIGIKGHNVVKDTSEDNSSYEFVFVL